MDKYKDEMSEDDPNSHRMIEATRYLGRSGYGHWGGRLPSMSASKTRGRRLVCVESCLPTRTDSVALMVDIPVLTSLLSQQVLFLSLPDRPFFYLTSGYKLRLMSTATLARVGRRPVISAMHKSQAIGVQHLFRSKIG